MAPAGAQPGAERRAIARSCSQPPRSRSGKADSSRFLPRAVGRQSLLWRGHLRQLRALVHRDGEGGRRQSEGELAYQAPSGQCLEARDVRGHGRIRGRAANPRRDWRLAAACEAAAARYPGRHAVAVQDDRLRHHRARDDRHRAALLRQARRHRRNRPLFRSRIHPRSRQRRGIPGNSGELARTAAALRRSGAQGESLCLHPLCAPALGLRLLPLQDGRADHRSPAYAHRSRGKDAGGSAQLRRSRSLRGLGGQRLRRRLSGRRPARGEVVRTRRGEVRAQRLRRPDRGGGEKLASVWALPAVADFLMLLDRCGTLSFKLRALKTMSRQEAGPDWGLPPMNAKPDLAGQATSLITEPGTRDLIWNDDTVGRFWAYYSQFPELYFSYRKGADVARFLKKHLPEAGEVLDYGCGPGHFVPHLLDHGYRVTGADFDVTTIGNGVTLAQREGFSGFFSVEELLQEGRRFDAVVMLEVVEHLDDYWLATMLRNAAELMRPGAVLVVTTPNEERLEDNMVFCPVSNLRFHRWQHMRSWSASSLSSALSGAGFRGVSTLTRNFREPREKSVPVWRHHMSRAASRLRKPQSLVAIARK
ncbi:hypothetical protein CLD20_13295 [Afifella sp. IM 167]|nr:hypothetical protein [Afifella sp. IM 167]